MLPGLSAPLTLTWLDENNETKGVSAPLDIWIAQIVLVLPLEVQTAVMDNVVAEVIRLNELQETDLEDDLEAVVDAAKNVEAAIKDLEEEDAID